MIQLGPFLEHLKFEITVLQIKSHTPLPLVPNVLYQFFACPFDMDTTYIGSSMSSRHFVTMTKETFKP